MLKAAHPLESIGGKKRENDLKSGVKERNSLMY
jgi:hypothetical protein